MPKTPIIFLGVDTGGTYTDAVVYDDGAGEVVAKAKAPTTHDDLAVGIGEALTSALATAEVDPSSVAMVSLSTTLATNALVEGRGRPAALIMIGFGEESTVRGGIRDALGEDPLIQIAGGHTPHGAEQEPLDVAALEQALAALPPEIEACAITAQFGVRNPDHELAARAIVRERTGLPVTCSHELADALNGPRRSVTALLNARLIALIEDLMATTRAILVGVGVDAPIMVVRGNGSLVSSAFVQERPVETILSGPAASLIGASHLAAVHDAVIADIGGTTTDIAVLRDGLPDHGGDGATVGGHQTMVEAVRMHTHGLGGDSQVAVADGAVGAQLTIGPRRVVPIVLVAHEAPDLVAGELERAAMATTPPGEWAGTFVQRTALASRARVSGNDAELLARVGEQWQPADPLAGTAVRTRTLRRLVDRGVIRLAGFTPTDASHVLGRQTTHDPAPARRAAALFAQRRDRHGTPVAPDGDRLSQAVVDHLVRLGAEAVLGAAFVRDGLPARHVTSAVVAAALDRAPRTAAISAGLAVPLVALGAPAATYAPAIGELLGAAVVVPDHADVANAIGAVVGRVRVRRSITVTSPRRGVFRVHAGIEPETVHDLDAARTTAEARGRSAVAAAMSAAGAPEFEVEIHWDERTAEVEGRPMFVEGTATVIGHGRPVLD